MNESFKKDFSVFWREQRDKVLWEAFLNTPLSQYRDDLVAMIDLKTDAGRLEFGRQAWLIFCEDMADDPAKAKVRMISNIQIAIKDAIEKGATANLALTRRPRCPDGPQMTFIPIPKGSE